MELIHAAGLGNKASLNELAEIAAERIKAFVFRLTLQDDLAQDISQETVTEMLQIFKKLRHRDRFWYWLYGIAYNKIRRHYGRSGQRRMQSLSNMPEEPVSDDRDETVAQAVTKELRQIVLLCMQRLDPRHRAILTMRCYDRLSYAQIAEHLSCTEFGARALFYRAKKSLARHLSAHGLGKGSSVLALVLFGKITAPTKAAATGIHITEATLSVGPAASLVGFFTGKAVLVGLSAGLLTVSAVTAPRLLSAVDTDRTVITSQQSSAMTQQGATWYYFPEGQEGPMMLRKHNDSGQWQVLQNAEGNYERQGNRVYIKNQRERFAGLDLKRMFMDSDTVTEAIDRPQAASLQSRPVSGSSRGLLIVQENHNDLDPSDLHVTHHLNVLQEDYFQPDWSAQAEVIDQRDVMHQRGWTYFTVSGTLASHSISGKGRIPFVYGALGRHAPWMTLRIGQQWVLTDTPDQTIWKDRRFETATRSTPGSFFAGLSRPWLGYHTLDLIRRDANDSGLMIEIEDPSDEEETCVVMNFDQGKLVYTVNMKTDLVSRIDMYKHNQCIGFMAFDYMEELSAPMTMPNRDRSAKKATYKPRNGLWLVDLVGTVTDTHR